MVTNSSFKISFKLGGVHYVLHGDARAVRFCCENKTGTSDEKTKSTWIVTFLVIFLKTRDCYVFICAIPNIGGMIKKLNASEFENVDPSPPILNENSLTQKMDLEYFQL